MGKKRGNKNYKNKEGKNGQKRVKGQWRCQTIPNEHPFFRQYYEKQLNLPQEQFTIFWSAMKQKLPVVFRVNPNCSNHEAFCKRIEDEQFIKSIIPTQEIQEKKEKQPQGEQKIEQKIETPQNNLYEPKQMPKLELINWYPGNIVYTMNTNKQTFKKSKIFAQFHKYLQKSFDSGLISRQQLVSMLPPLYLNIKSDDIVLDLCAAPGSKTSQILQMIYGERRWLAKGCVIANDADYSRAQMLIHQLHRSGTTGMAVINHPGQFLPELYSNKVGSVRQKFQFDKILCDVPCSGDGATRKLPIKWSSWHTSDGMVLHPLQLSILMKAINLLKKGGYIVYSTCSLNPIQNEAVLSGLFQKVAKGLEIVDIHPMFGVKGRRGLLNWKVFTIADNFQDIKEQYKDYKAKQQCQRMEQQKPKKQKLLKEYSSYEELKHFKKAKPTMFPPSEQQAKRIHLDHTMRILPHDQNSGGFYVALLKKTQQFQWNYGTNDKKKKQGKGQIDIQQQFVQNNLPQMQQPVPQQAGEEEKDGDGENKNEQQGSDQEEDNQDNQKQEEAEQKNQLIQQQIEKKDEKREEKIEEKGWGQRKNDKKKQKSSKYENYHNIKEQDFENIKKFYAIPDIFKNLLYVRSYEGENASKKVLLISEGVRKFLQADTDKKIKLVNMGCQVFEKGKQSFAGNECLYRLCQDGIHFILDYLGQRKIKVPLQFFKKAISIKTLAHDAIEDLATKQKIKATSQGSFCIYIDEVIDGRHVIDALVGQNFKNSFHLMVSKEDQASLSIRYLQ